MILALRIANFAVIEESEVAFDDGLTVLTGETGAGKSMLVDALALLVGGRGDTEVVRSGCDEAIVEGVFRRTAALAARLEALGLPDAGEELSVRRTVGRAGRGKAHVNGSLVGIGVLAKLMKGVVDIAGQSEHMSLFDPSAHLGLIDDFASHEGLRARYREGYEALQDLERRLAELGGDERQAQARLEFARFQLDELERLGPAEGEERALDDERRRLAGAEKLRGIAADAELLLASQDGSALELMGRVQQQLFEGAKVDARFATAAQGIAESRALADDVVRQLGRFQSALDSDPGRLAEVDERLDGLRRLARKHAVSPDALSSVREGLLAEVGRLEGRRAAAEALGKELAKARSVAQTAAELLSASRRKAGRRFAAEVRRVLGDLAMGGACLEVEWGDRPLGPDGKDSVELLFGANRGEPPRALEKTASGGEASRLMLAAKSVLSDRDACGASVMDEVDAGVGGAVADAVGRLIKEVSRHRQVLCITHLAQVAVHADAHMVVWKEARSGRTLARIAELEDQAGRTRELARMLSGVEVTREALGAAQALFRSAHKVSARPGRSVRSVRRSVMDTLP